MEPEPIKDWKIFVGYVQIVIVKQKISVERIRYQRKKRLMNSFLEEWNKSSSMRQTLMKFGLDNGQNYKRLEKLILNQEKKQ
jgi:hypothetical protein